MPSRPARSPDGESTSVQRIAARETREPREPIPTHFEWARTFEAHEQPIAARTWAWEGDFPRHDHDFFELQFVLGGRATQITALGRQEVAAGDVLLMRPKNWHAYEGCQEFRTVFCAFRYSTLRHELMWTLEDPVLAKLLWYQNSPGTFAVRFDAGRTKRTKTVFLHLTELCHAGAPFFSRMVCFLQILHEIFDTLPADATLQERAKSAAHHPAVIRAIRQMDDDLGGNHTVENLARECHLDPSYFGRVFQRVTGITPKRFLEDRRMERAATLLRGTDQSVGDIAAAVGLFSHAHFSFRFRKYWGVAPSAYRLGKAENAPHPAPVA